MHILLVDTCTERGVVAYSGPEGISFERELPFGTSQSKFLIPTLVDFLRSFTNPLPVDFVAAGMGPGSYTGIRLGVSVAQALAYSWKVPLVGVSSLEGFIPSRSTDELTPVIRYAAVLDARIGGVYCQREGDAQPQVVPIERIGLHLQGFTHLITPHAKSLRPKIELHAKGKVWTWEEHAPSAQALIQSAKRNFMRGSNTVIPPQHLELLYLRETQAEAERKIDILHSPKNGSCR